MNHKYEGLTIWWNIKSDMNIFATVVTELDTAFKVVLLA